MWASFSSFAIKHVSEVGIFIVNFDANSAWWIISRILASTFFGGEMQIKFPTEIKKNSFNRNARFPLDIVLMLAPAAAAVAVVRYIAAVCSLNVFLGFIASLCFLHRVLPLSCSENRVSGNAFFLLPFIRRSFNTTSKDRSFWLHRPNFAVIEWANL